MQMTHSSIVKTTPSIFRTKMEGLKYVYTLNNVDYDVTVSIVTYTNNGRNGILLTLPTEEPFAVASVNISEAELAFDEVCIKTWGGNEGMLDFLVRNNIVEDTGRKIPAGFVQAPVVKLLK